MTIGILYETEGIAASTLEPLNDLFRNCEFKTLLTHIAVRVHGRTLRQYTINEMREIPDGDRGSGIGVFQPNSIYVFCKYEEDDEGSTTQLVRHPIFSDLILPVRNFNPLTLAVPADHRLQRQYWEIEVNGIQKHIIFKYEHTGQDIGWYNLRTNILWISDVAHNSTQCVSLLKEVLDRIFELRRFGKFKDEVLPIGADPEFEILDSQNRLLGANMFFTFQDKVGTDGHCETGEIRPEHARSPLKLVRNVKRLIRRISKNGSLPKGAKVCAGGGTRVNTGGHIHFGARRIPANARETLYDLVGKAVLQHQTGVRNDCSELISRTGGDAVRSSDSHVGWEWRSLPSWLVGEDVATCIVVTTYCVVKALYVAPITMKETVPATLRSLPLYPTYKKYIEDFISTFHSPTKIKMEGVPIIPNWRITNPDRAATIRVVSSNQGIRRFFIPISYPVKEDLTIQIEYLADKIVSYGLSKEMSKRLEKIANGHFLEYMEIKTEEEIRRLGRDYLSNFERRGDMPFPNVVIFLPGVWQTSKRDKRVLFKQIGRLIKDSILEKEE